MTKLIECNMCGVREPEGETELITSGEKEWTRYGNDKHLCPRCVNIWDEIILNWKDNKAKAISDMMTTYAYTEEIEEVIVRLNEHLKKKKGYVIASKGNDVSMKVIKDVVMERR